jgi:hypothetical protein
VLIVAVCGCGVWVFWIWGFIGFLHCIEKSTELLCLTFSGPQPGVEIVTARIFGSAKGDAQEQRTAVDTLTGTVTTESRVSPTQVCRGIITIDPDSNIPWALTGIGAERYLRLSVPKRPLLLAGNASAPMDIVTMLCALGWADLCPEPGQTSLHRQSR